MPLSPLNKIPYFKLLFFVLVIGLMCVPQNAPIRILTPGNWEKVLDLKPPNELKFVASDAIEFDIAINASEEVFQETLDITKIMLMEQKHQQSQMLEVARIRPNLFAWRIRIPVEVLGPNPTCKLQLKIANQASIFESCAKAINQKATYFEFGTPVLPGIFKATLLVQNAKETDYFIVHGFPGKNKSFWVPVESANQLSTLLALWRWSAERPLFTFGVVLLLIVVFLSGFTWLEKEFDWRKLVYCAAFATLGISLLTTPLFSGHDETAHLSMFRTAALQAQKNSNDVPPAEQQTTFNKEAEKTKFKFNFFRLNNAKPLTDGSCPHATATGSCGESEKPTWLYRQYAKTFAYLSPDSWSPETILWFGRGTSVFWLALFTGAALLFFGGEFIPLMLCATVLCGAYLGQFSSLSNDVPMYCLGFFLFVALSSTFRDAPTFKQGLGLVFGIVFVFILKSAERSWVTALPALGITIVLYLGKILVLKTPQFRRAYSWAQTRFEKTFPGFLGCAFWYLLPLGIGTVSMCLFPAFAHFVPTLKKVFPGGWTLLNQVSPDAEMLEEFAKLDFKAFTHVLVYHFRSVWGSFIWGHQYYPKWFNLCGLALLLYAGVNAIFITSNFGRSGNFSLFFKSCGALAIAGLLFGIHMTLISAIEWPNLYQPLIVSESFLKLRLIAPSSANIYFLFFLPFVIERLSTNCKRSFSIHYFRQAIVLCVVIVAFLQPALYLIAQW